MTEVTEKDAIGVFFCIYWLPKRLPENISKKLEGRKVKLKSTTLVETTGIEPVTPCMSSKYSNQLSYASTKISVIII